ncbi:hypothetical protein CIG1485E_1038 [Campylobacter iguaniorum]|uniref:Uncharacterized protein n=1 Tax=Campylobacter iguaniorum TaxID=1244531 RepID=A0A076FGG1_9BACT|nr:hypothetical protein [Campylobacter iguaniorum]AII14874.1 hypothetical protein CIG1485E_1038 [Campylobacter iguaniorum]
MQTDLENYSKEQIFNLAYNYEYKGILIYSNFKNISIFDEILVIKQNGVQLLKTTSEQKNYKLENQIHQVLNPDFIDEKLIVAINYELELIKFYESACKLIKDDEQDLFFRLWATSSNEYIPALKSALNSLKFDTQKEQINGVWLENSQIQNFLDQATKIANGDASKEDINALVNHPNFSFFGGVVAGGLVGMLINEITKEKNDE